MKNLIAFIPARSGSKRVPNKNIKPFFGHPLIAYTIQSAIDAGIFDGIYCTSDSENILDVANHYGAKHGILRPKEIAGDLSPDQEWIDHAKVFIEFDAFAIIRPTNPFRTGETIKRAYDLWDKQLSIKAIEPVRQRPEKMWHVIDKTKIMLSLMSEGLHLLQSSALGPLHVQNGCLEFRPSAVMPKGLYYQYFFTEGYEGFDINTPEDWILAEELVKRGLAKLPETRRPSI